MISVSAVVEKKDGASTQHTRTVSIHVAIHHGQVSVGDALRGAAGSVPSVSAWFRRNNSSRVYDEVCTESR